MPFDSAQGLGTSAEKAASCRSEIFPGEASRRFRETADGRMSASASVAFLNLWAVLHFGHVRDDFKPLILPEGNGENGEGLFLWAFSLLPPLSPVKCLGLVATLSCVGKDADYRELGLPANIVLVVTSAWSRTLK